MDQRGYFKNRASKRATRRAMKKADLTAIASFKNYSGRRRIDLLPAQTRAIHVITMPTSKQARTSSKQKMINNTQELRDALVYAAIGLRYDYTNQPVNANEAEDRKAGRILAELAKQLGATL